MRRLLAALTVRPAPVAGLTEVWCARTGSFRGHMRSGVTAERAFRRRCRPRHSAFSLPLPANPEPSGCRTRPRPLTGWPRFTLFTWSFPAVSGSRGRGRSRAARIGAARPSPRGAGRVRAAGVRGPRMGGLSGDAVGGRRGRSATPDRHPTLLGMANSYWTSGGSVAARPLRCAPPTVHPCRGNGAPVPRNGPEESAWAAPASRIQEGRPLDISRAGADVVLGPGRSASPFG